MKSANRAAEVAAPDLAILAIEAHGSLERYRRSRFEPQRVALENASGKILEELLQPRSSFPGHTLETRWSDLQVAYFAGCARLRRRDQRPAVASICHSSVIS